MGSELQQLQVTLQELEADLVDERCLYDQDKDCRRLRWIQELNDLIDVIKVEIAKKTPPTT